jgi:RNA polymerase sigma factor for flagellar operon FliA
MQVQRVSLRRQSKVLRADRDQIVLDNLSLVKAIAIRVHENLPVHVELDDLNHAGVMGLFDAVEKFDAAKNVEFRSYAKHRIKGAILDSLRQLDWASRDMRKRQKQIDSVTRDLSTRLGRTPNESEVAQEMGVGIERWQRMVGELRTTGLVSGTAHTDDERDRIQEFADTAELQPDRVCASRQLRTTLARAMQHLPVRYQKVVILYYTKELTMKEIGDIIGVNESRVSQIHKVALKKMATALQGQGIRSAEAF